MLRIRDNLYVIMKKKNMRGILVSVYCKLYSSCYIFKIRFVI